MAMYMSLKLLAHFIWNWNGWNEHVVPSQLR